MVLGGVTYVGVPLEITDGVQCRVPLRFAFLVFLAGQFAHTAGRCGLALFVLVNRLGFARSHARPF